MKKEAHLYSPVSSTQSYGKQVRAIVTLPSGALIDYQRFCPSIAQALHPADEQDLVGVQCITGKIVTHHVPMEPAARVGVRPGEAGMQSVLISDDGRTLDQLSKGRNGTEGGNSALDLMEPVGAQVVELSLPYALTDDDRRELEKLLPQLPALRYPISEDEEVARAYAAKTRPPTRPDRPA